MPSELETIPFARPDIGEDEIAAVVETLRSGWLTAGPRVGAFEAAFRDLMGGVVEAVAVASATAGLEVALAAFGIGPGDEVITSTYTFTASALCAVRVGATPVLVDVEAGSFNLDPQAVEDAITPRTRAIIPVHIGGQVCDMAAINAIARRHGLRVIEDAAHALPARCGGRLVGQGGADATVFSFYATKNLTTGEGGMITFADPEAARLSRRLRLHGIDRDAHRRGSGGRSWWYEALDAGFKANMPDMEAAMGVVQLARLPALQARREALWAAYDRGLAGLPLVKPPEARPGDTHARHLYAIRLTDEAPIERDAFIERMARQGVACSVHFIPLHLHPHWRDSLGLAPDAIHGRCAPMSGRSACRSTPSLATLSRPR